MFFFFFLAMCFAPSQKVDLLLIDGRISYPVVDPSHLRGNSVDDHNLMGKA